MHVENVRVDDNVTLGTFRGSKAVGFRRIVEVDPTGRFSIQYPVFRSLSETQIVFIFPGKISCIGQVKRIKGSAVFLQTKRACKGNNNSLAHFGGIWKCIGRKLSNLRHVRK